MMWPQAGLNQRLPAKRAAPANLEMNLDDPVTSVKNLQRADPVAREQWIAYCDANADGTRDPSKHDAAFVQGFITQYQSGMRIAGDTDGIPNVTKMLQKRSTSFKNMWAKYCAQNGDGKHDPAKHDAAFHMQFYDDLAQMGFGGGKGGGKSMPAMMGMGKGMGESPMKRMKPDPASMMQMMSTMMASMSGMSGMSSAMIGPKENLVARIKTFQKENEQQQQMWSNFCDTELGGVRDPARHDVATLQKFCNSHIGPQQHGLPAINTDPHTTQLVAKVKQFQKLGQQQKEAWWAFCGEVKDPARHTAAELQEFVTQHIDPL